MSERDAIRTPLSLSFLYAVKSLRRSSVITSGQRVHSAWTVLRPTPIASGRDRSCTKALTTCRSTGSMASGGTLSWQASAAAVSNSVTSRCCGCR